MSVLSVFYSQQGEDLFIYRNFINKSTPGSTFIELGACDGVLYSNTKFFEDTLNFSGIMIEPIKEMYDMLIQNRRNCICINAAISDKVGETVMIGNSPVAGIVETMSPEFKNMWHKNSSFRTVPVLQLKNILERYNITHVDLLSLDVENGEYNVLKSIDFSTVEFYLICIELDGHDQIKDQNCRDLLTRNGFVFKHRMTIN